MENDYGGLEKINSVTGIHKKIMNEIDRVDDIINSNKGKKADLLEK